MGRATADEQRFLVDLMTGNLRQGALDGVVLAAVATPTTCPRRWFVARRCSPAPPPRWRPRSHGRGRGARAGGAGRRAAGAPDARGVGEDHRRGGGGGRRGRAARRRQARRHPGAGAPPLRGGQRLHAQPRRDHRAGARGRRGRRRAARWRPRARRRGDRHARRRAAGAVPGHRGPHGELGRRRGLRERVPLTTFLFDVLHRDGVDLIDERPGCGTTPSPTSHRTSWCRGC